MNREYYTADVASTYGKDKFHIYSHTCQTALTQLKDCLMQLTGGNAIDTLVDVAIGKGNSMVASKQLFSIRHLIGNDLSPAMLDYAKRNIPELKAICDSAINISKHVNKADVVFAHFLLSYVPAAKLFDEIKKILVPNGLLSITTSTLKNLHEIQELMIKEIPFIFNRKKIFDKHSGGVPADSAGLIAQLQAGGFEVMRQDIMQIPVRFTSFADIWEFSVEEGWSIQYFHRTGIRQFDRIFSKTVISMLQFWRSALRYPIVGTTDICVLTCRKLTNSVIPDVRGA